MTDGEIERKIETSVGGIGCATTFLLAAVLAILYLGRDFKDKLDAVDARVTALEQTKGKP